MKRFTKLSCLLVLALLIFGMNQAEAQRSKKRSRSSKNDEYFDESGNFAHKLWYGGGFNLQFFSNNAFGRGGNEFVIGISPMVGYKILPNVSIGPRVELSYLGGRYDLGGGTIAKFNGLSYGIGPFARFKPFEQIFAQVEFQYFSSPVAVGLDGDRIQTVRDTDENFFIGVGYNSSAGGLLGYEVMILYNLLEDDNTTNLPIYFRFGLTYNF